MKRSQTNSGFLYFFEKIVRCHPLLYFVTRYLIRYTNIFEEDANGVSFLNLDKKVNIIDVGASDGIASKFFCRKLKINKIICFEPNKPYARILKRLNKSLNKSRKFIEINCLFLFFGSINIKYPRIKDIVATTKAKKNGVL